MMDMVVEVYKKVVDYIIRIQIFFFIVNKYSKVILLKMIEGMIIY